MLHVLRDDTGKTYSFEKWLELVTDTYPIAKNATPQQIQEVARLCWESDNGGDDFMCTLHAYHVIAGTKCLCHLCSVKNAN